MRSIIFTTFLITLFPFFTLAQGGSSFAQDTTALFEQLVKEKFKSKIAAEQKSQAENKKLQETAEKDDPNEKLNTEIERIQALQKLLGPASVSALSGNVTISEGTSSLAETRIMAYKALDPLLKTFISDMTSTTVGSSTTCIALPCSSTTTVLIYNASYFDALSDYQALLKELSLLKDEYKTQKSETANLAAASVIGAIALGSSIVKSLVDLASIFKSDREIKINKESFDEEVIVSKIKAIDPCCLRQYYYPALFTPTPSSSTLVTSLSEIELLKSEIQQKVKSRKEEIQNIYNEEIKEANKKKGKAKQDAIEIAEKKKKNLEVKPNAVVANLQILNERFESIKGELGKTIESTPKMSLLRHLLRIEGILEKIKDGTYILKVTAEGKGTNVITKFLWSTTIKHSAFVEARFQLFNHQGVLIKAGATQEYISLKKSKDI